MLGKETIGEGRPRELLLQWYMHKGKVNLRRAGEEEMGKFIKVWKYFGDVADRSDREIGV